MSEKKSDPGLRDAHRWLAAVSTELAQDPAVISSLTTELLDLTRDIAHGPSRPAAPLTAFLVGLASGAALDTADGSTETLLQARENIARVLALLERYEAKN